MNRGSPPSIGLTPSFRVHTYDCPWLGHSVSEIWRGETPWIPGNVYLRREGAYASWAEGGYEVRAMRLIHLARWCERAGVPFWDKDLRLGRDQMVEFRQSLLARTVPGAKDTLTASTVSRVMGEVLKLCRFWVQEGERIKGDVRLDRPRASPGRSEKRPPAFKVASGRTQGRGEESLTPEEVQAIWTFLLVRRRPPKKCPPGMDQERWKLRTACWARDCMLWALLCGTAIRRGEAVGVMVEDVTWADGCYWLDVVEPDAKAVARNPMRKAAILAGARHKTGSRKVVVMSSHTFGEVFKLWMAWRPFLVARTGVPDHGMLLVKKPGGDLPAGSPMRYEGMGDLFKVINREVGPFTGESAQSSAPRRTFKLSPHRVRHTMASLMKLAGLPIEFRQALLGHRRPETTDEYGTVYMRAATAQATAFSERFRSLGALQ